MTKTCEETTVHPHIYRLIAETRMDELRREADRARLAARIRPPAVHRMRMRVGSWLIGAGEMLTTPVGVRAVELPR